MEALESSTPADKEEECGPVGRKFCEQAYAEKASLLEIVHEPGLVKVRRSQGHLASWTHMEKEVELGES